MGTRRPKLEGHGIALVNISAFGAVLSVGRTKFAIPAAQNRMSTSDAANRKRIRRFWCQNNVGYQATMPCILTHSRVVWKIGSHVYYGFSDGNGSKTSSTF